MFDDVNNHTYKRYLFLYIFLIQCDYIKFLWSTLHLCNHMESPGHIELITSAHMTNFSTFIGQLFYCYVI